MSSELGLHARGRLIEQGANRVWLYRKATDAVVSVPLEQSVLEDAASEWSG